MGEHRTAVHLGEAIAWLRRLRRMTQLELAVATGLSKTAIAPAQPVKSFTNLRENLHLGGRQCATASHVL